MRLGFSDKSGSTYLLLLSRYFFRAGKVMLGGEGARAFFHFVKGGPPPPKKDWRQKNSDDFCPRLLGKNYSLVELDCW